MNNSLKMGEELTGKYCFSSEMFTGNLILWVEAVYSGNEEDVTYWRRGKVYDLPKLKELKL